MELDHQHHCHADHYRDDDEDKEHRDTTKDESVGFLPKRAVIRSRLRPMTPRSPDTITSSCIYPPFLRMLHYLPGRATICVTLPGRVAGLAPHLKDELTLPVLQEEYALGTCIAGTTAALHGFDLCLTQRDNGLREWDVAESRRILLAIMDNPPEHVRSGHPLVGIRLGLVHDRPSETGNGVGGYRQAR